MNVPAVANVVVLLPPAEMLPVSQTPVSLVEVCAIPSLFRQVIVVFFAMVTLAGPNAMPDKTTVFGGAGVGAAGVEGPYGFDESLLHPTNIETVRMTSKKVRSTGSFCMVGSFRATR